MLASLISLRDLMPPDYSDLPILWLPLDRWDMMSTSREELMANGVLHVAIS